jgi:hypothetical protein
MDNSFVLYYYRSLAVKKTRIKDIYIISGLFTFEEFDHRILAHNR